MEQSLQFGANYSIRCHFAHPRRCHELATMVPSPQLPVSRRKIPRACSPNVKNLYGDYRAGPQGTHHYDRLEGRQQRTRLCRLHEFETARELVRRFRELVRDRVPEDLASWIADCQRSGIAELKTFADGLQREEEVIRAALELPYSNGVTEGHVNRLKMIKRTAYGRASFGLLHQRVLAQV